jgi:hypothetical protein
MKIQAIAEAPGDAVERMALQHPSAASALPTERGWRISLPWLSLLAGK